MTVKTFKPFRPGNLIRTPEEIQRAVSCLAESVGKHLNVLDRRRTVDLVPVLDAAFVLAADFSREWYNLYGLDAHVCFAKVSTYHGTVRRTTPVVQWVSEPPSEKTVVILDVILDTGATMAAMLHDCKNRGYLEVLGAVLFTRMPLGRVEPPLLAQGPVLTTAFLETRKFVVGYGADFNGHYRQLPWIAELGDERI